MKAIFACANFGGTPFHVGSHEIARVLLERGWKVAFIANFLGKRLCIKDTNK